MDFADPTPPRDPFRWPLFFALRGGVSLAAALFLAGLAAHLARGPAPVDAGRGSPAELLASLSLSSLARPEVLIGLGLLVLVCLPLARVALSLALFVAQRDRIYVGLTAIVLGLLGATALRGLLL